MESNKLIHVHIYEGWKGEFDFYFGSIRAIYAKLPVEAVGINESSLRETMRHTKLYRNKHCMVKKGEIMRNSRRNKQ